MVANIPPTGGVNDTFARWLAGFGAILGGNSQVQASVKNQIGQRAQQLRGREINLDENHKANKIILEKNRRKHNIYKSYNTKQITEKQQNELLGELNSPAPLSDRPIPKLGHEDMPTFPLSGFGQAIWRKTTSFINSGNSGSSRDTFGSITLANKQNKNKYNTINENQIVGSLDTLLSEPFEIHLMTPLSGALAALAAAVIIRNYGNILLKFTFNFINLIFGFMFFLFNEVFSPGDDDSISKIDFDKKND